MKLSKMGESNEPKDLLYFQNLVPGTSDSPFIDRYKKECLDDNDPDNERRKSLLDEYPPILSFHPQQKKKFYEDEARMCSFCCGGVLTSDNGLKNIDNYMYSNNSGKLYEGSAANIKSQLQEEARQEKFGSAEQNQRMTEINQFSAVVDQREKNSAPAMTNAATQKQSSTLNPLKTDLKPRDADS